MGLSLIQSPLLASSGGVRHAFSSREGGVSPAPFASLNLAFGVGDDVARVVENRRRFAARAGFEDAAFAEVQQVHGRDVVRVTAGEHRHGVLARVQADAIWTEDPGVAVAIRTADCAPILLAALDGRDRVGAVAAVHAGWRSACARIVERTVGMLCARGFRLGAMRAAVGPAIGPNAFEVGPEVIAAARRSLDGERPPCHAGTSARPRLNLPELVRRQLIRAGLQTGQVEVLDLCTHTESEKFYSHRRDRGQTGRHLSAIQIVR